MDLKTRAANSSASHVSTGVQRLRAATCAALNIGTAPSALARGACVHWAHPHAASHLIAKACKPAHQQFGWSVFFAYADPMAGEIGYGLPSGELALSRRWNRAQQGPEPLALLQPP